MEYVTIAGQRVPRLGLGTGELRGDVCIAALSTALAMGYRHVDTAARYDNEEEVGRTLRASRVPRHDVFLTTKVWWSEAAAPRVYASVDSSLRRLGTTYVDLLLMHWPTGGIPLAETMDALHRVQQAGKARHVGVSNFTPSQVAEAARYAPVFCNQVEYHPLLGQERLLTQADEMDYLLMAYSPIAQGAVNRDPLVRRLADGYGRTPAQIALRWLVQQPRVAAIPRSATPAHLAGNLAVFDFALTDDDMKALSDSARHRSLRLSNPVFAPDWTR